MRIIKNEPNISGAYPPILKGFFKKCPEGYLAISDALDLSIFNEYNGFIVLGVEDDIVVSMTPNEEAWKSWRALKSKENLETSRASKLQLISQECSKIITAGVDVETSQGLEHFSLEETDQINLNAALQAVQQGATSYPYHADKQLCRMFTAEEILAVVDAGTLHKVYHTTLCNHILVWVRRAETIEELESIQYSADNLPEDLAANMQSILSPIPVPTVSDTNGEVEPPSTEA